MNGIIERLFRFALGWLQARCDHPPESVVADLLEGDGGMDAVQVQWCRICGAYQTVYTARPAGGIGGMVPAFAGLGGGLASFMRGGLLGQRANVKTQVPPPANVANITFPIQTGWRTPEPRWQDGGRSMRRDAEEDRAA